MAWGPSLCIPLSIPRADCEGERRVGGGLIKVSHYRATADEPSVLVHKGSLYHLVAPAE
jgi:hypothetical protein